MNSNLPLVSIIIPCRNEERFIGKCLDSIIEQDYLKDKLEVLVVDGMSEDKTREIVQEFVRNCSVIKILENKKRITPSGMNLGVKESRGGIVIIVNAHSVLDREFIKQNIDYLKKVKNADAVGGKLQTTNECQGIIARAIPLVVDSIFGAGGKRYRTRKEEGFIKDTLPYCAYRREVFSKIGYFDEELIRDQDEEFNYRLIKQGGKIYFTPRIKSYLFIRPSLQKLWRQHFQYGYWKVKVAQKVGTLSVSRQIIPAIFAGSLIVSLIFAPIFWQIKIIFWLIFGSYLLLALLFSIKISYREGCKYLPILPLVFFVLHFSYGLGFLNGIIDFVILKKRKIRDVSLTR